MLHRGLSITACLCWTVFRLCAESPLDGTVAVCGISKGSNTGKEEKYKMCELNKRITVIIMSATTTAIIIVLLAPPIKQRILPL